MEDMVQLAMTQSCSLLLSNEWMESNLCRVRFKDREGKRLHITFRLARGELVVEGKSLTDI